MSQTALAKPRPPLSQRVPGLLCSLLIAVVCLLISASLAWRHPLVALHCEMKPAPPSSDSPLSDAAIIVDATVTHKLWGLITIRREELREINHFIMRTATQGGETHTESVHAVTAEGSSEVFADSEPGLLQCVARLNSELDEASPGVTTLRRSAWSWFAASWTLLLLGILILVRNVVIPVWHRHRRGALRG